MIKILVLCVWVRLKDGGDDACKDPPTKARQAQHYQNLVKIFLQDFSEKSFYLRVYTSLIPADYVAVKRF